MKIAVPPTPVVSAADLDDLGPVRMLYVPAGHETPPGLMTIPLEEWVSRAKKTRTGLDDLAFWRSEIQKLGVGPDALSVVVDDGRMIEAARVWFILQYFGLPAVVLNGGLPALGGKVPQQAPPATAPLALEPGAGPVGLSDREHLKASLGTVQVFDARTAAEFRGEDLKGAPRGGHLPGAGNLSHADLLDGARLKDASEIAELMSKSGLDGSRSIVSHCHGGGRAALAALAAVAAGAKDVRVYYLSFADWAADESCPLVRPD
ncbi:MAG: rhodanese family protein [Salinarimonadaceae bacterium]|nr:MAG: rhodanese family protein [Salinarimonadaceae bacterium]